MWSQRINAKIIKMLMMEDTNMLAIGIAARAVAVMNLNTIIKKNMKGGKIICNPYFLFLSKKMHQNDEISLFLLHYNFHYYFFVPIWWNI